MQPLQISIAPTIHIGQEKWCLPYAGFLQALVDLLVKLICKSVVLKLYWQSVSFFVPVLKFCPHKTINIQKGCLLSTVKSKVITFGNFQSKIIIQQQVSNHTTSFKILLLYHKQYRHIYIYIFIIQHTHLSLLSKLINQYSISFNNILNLNLAFGCSRGFFWGYLYLQYSLYNQSSLVPPLLPGRPYTGGRNYETYPDQKLYIYLISFICYY